MSVPDQERSPRPTVKGVDVGPGDRGLNSAVTLAKLCGPADAPFPHLQNGSDCSSSHVSAAWRPQHSEGPAQGRRKRVSPAVTVACPHTQNKKVGLPREL